VEIARGDIGLDETSGSETGGAETGGEETGGFSGEGEG